MHFFKNFFTKKRKFLYATLKDKLGAVYNAHIINLNTEQGTFTNQEGKFRILAKTTDCLQISFVGYKTTVFKVTTKHFGLFENTIHLNKEVIELNEIVLKKHNLIGALTIDAKKTPKNIGKDRSESALDFSMINFEEKIIRQIDAIDRSKAPNMQKQTDPTAKFAGIGIGYTEGIDQYGAAKRRLRKETKYKEAFPKMLISEFGEKFFFVDLKIPKEKYYHFLEYCNPLNIEKLYTKGKILSVIKILKQESKSYLKIINLLE
ncbi:conserved protein of unknown function [Tenacibaculum soleae]|uniref:carboxypeptidase-like regulatory domain-containing protein n=1 Tax=Tenacibaculum soleae TaxID=447689 RepID=UPI003AB1C376